MNIGIKIYRKEKGAAIIRIIKHFSVFILLLFFADNGMACRYTVREIGFADFGKDSYQLILFKDGTISETDIKLFENISSAALLNTNITGKVIDIKKEKSSPFLKYYHRPDKGQWPDLIFVSPAEKVKVLRLYRQEDFTQSIWALLETIVTSPARDRLREHIVASYGVIYFIEGSRADENSVAERTIKQAVERTEQIMTSLPKPVNKPPRVIRIKADDRESEDILLWSLGWEGNESKKPAVAIMYGRGRRMGPMLEGDFIREEVITNMLRFVGEDCECGLDRTWMLGTMIPLRWDSDLKSNVLSEYGFDADNPLVVSEMIQILSVAPARTNRSVDTGILYGYTENILKLSNPANKSGTTEPEMTDEGFFSGTVKSFTFSLIGIVLITIAGGFVIFRSRKTNT